MDFIFRNSEKISVTSRKKTHFYTNFILHSVKPNSPNYSIFPSGCSFNDLSSGSTGVFIGTSSRDGHELLTDDDPDNISGYEMTGGNRAMLSNRLSYCFDLKGNRHLGYIIH